MEFNVTLMPLLSGLIRQLGNKSVMKKTFNSLKKILTFCAISFLSFSINAKDTESLKTAVFAGGCFWCMEEAFEQLDGVVDVISGYSGGMVKNPSYEMVSKGKTKHLEAILIRYDPSIVEYERLLKEFWENVDPFDGEGQFCDRGEHYRSAIFYGNNEEYNSTVKTKREMEESLSPEILIRTMILPRKKFYPAEEYHQNYYEKNPYRYNYYKFRCGRSQRLKELGEYINSKN